MLSELTLGLSSDDGVDCILLPLHASSFLTERTVFTEEKVRGLLQTTILESLGCIWFNRTEVKDRVDASRKFREHAHGDDNNPLLIFSEGTCVNNEYIVMFKKSAFEIDASVCPVAIKYNKIFVDAFWNSRK
ncbi:hypothetical protein BVRB_3g056070 isoform A [Beta vulgaris subsp. vulgaris]|uniref:Phospholipid/glycerol acyltransferase domain-containing protein n=1 Tax=Beta vulgaris subsp. vulgaris TaxID=3555 RepID=A0A0J8CQ81_BETVV|nr:hypothetical protein BVRB_3g056070 isoform A [Beta vulgaris subsp. vulgaris]